jgi:hypothetical protein
MQSAHAYAQAITLSCFTFFGISHVPSHKTSITLRVSLYVGGTKSAIRTAANLQRNRKGKADFEIFSSFSTYPIKKRPIFVAD